MNTPLRTFFFLLLAANLVIGVILAAPYLGLGLGGSPEGEPERLRNQLNADRLSVAPSSPAATPPAVEPAAALPSAVSAPAAPVCVMLSRLPNAQAKALAEAARAQAMQVKETPGPLSYWVHLPPLPSREDADARAEAMKAAGVVDLFVVQDEGPNRNAISLGLYRNEVLARRQMDALIKKGVKGLKIETREPEAAASVQIAGAAEAVERLAQDAIAQTATIQRAVCAAN